MPRPLQQLRANKARLNNRRAALSAMLSGTLTRHPASTLTPAPEVPTIKRSPNCHRHREACDLHPSRSCRYCRRDFGPQAAQKK
jgi:hypothetical protein